MNAASPRLKLWASALFLFSWQSFPPPVPIAWPQPGGKTIQIFYFQPKKANKLIFCCLEGLRQHYLVSFTTSP